MPDIARPEPLFLADDPALDLLNSIAAPFGDKIEWLGDGQDFLNWLKQTGLVSSDDIERFRQEMGPGALDKVTEQVRGLREWFRKVVAQHAGQPLGPSVLPQLAELNRLLGRYSTYNQIGAVEDKKGNVVLCWQQHRQWNSPKDLLLPVAEIMGNLICHEDFMLVKNCEGPTCTMWFLDISKNHTRRWCSMAICGNRAKAATHRAKKKQSINPPSS